MAAKRKSTVSQILADSKWNTRKLIGFAAIFLGSLLLCYTDKSTGADTYKLWIWLFAIYCTGNIGAKVATPGILGKLKAVLKRKNNNKRKINKGNSK